MILMANEDATKVLQSGEQPLNLSAELVAPQRPTVLGHRPGSISFVRSNQFDSLLLKLGIKFFAVVGFVSDQSSRGISDKPAFNSILDKGDFMWRSRCNVYGERKMRS